jgi:lipopolysaccharide transport system permease protein
LVDFAVSTMVLLLLVAIYGIGWSFNLLVAPLLLGGIVFWALGAGTLLSALTVAYRDFRYASPTSFE